MSGVVLVNDQKQDKGGVLVDSGAQLRLSGDSCNYVSRGGLKLEGALETLKLDIIDYVCLDLGASTGGFTDCLLRFGARKVYAFDVGRGQLDWKLRQNPRVVVRDAFNVRYLTPKEIEETVDLIVIDLSFISVKQVLVPLRGFQEATVLALIKPQFEAERYEVEPGQMFSNGRRFCKELRTFRYKTALKSWLRCPPRSWGGKAIRRFFFIFDMQRYSAYGPWLRRRFGARVYRVSVDGGFTCPNRDGKVGWGGCTYCSNDSFRPEGAGPERSLAEQLEEGISFLSRRFRAERFIVYWQNYTSTYAPVEVLTEKFARALAFDDRIVGMTVGTRADCVEDNKLAMLRELAFGHYVCMEYGLESIYDRTLLRVNRRHDFNCFADAVRRTQDWGLPVGAHVIMGFEGETREEQLAYAKVLNELKVDFVKLHHLHVVTGTRMAKDYLRKPFPLFDFQGWVEFVCDFLERLEPRIIVQRLFGWAPDEHLLAPLWRKSKAEILYAIAGELKRRDSWQGKRLGAAVPGQETILAH
jgi:radical SAM protein (TIGR01212 family)